MSYTTFEQAKREASEREAKRNPKADGMTLRDYFAAKAMQAFLSKDSAITCPDEIIEMTRQAGFNLDATPNMLYTVRGNFAQLEAFAKLVAERERKFYMQLFLDHENQPTQFGTAIEQYRKQEVNDETEMCAEVVLDEIKKYGESNFQHLRYVLNRIYFKISARGQQ